MPLPSEDTTPPVTNTKRVMGRPPRARAEIPRSRAEGVSDGGEASTGGCYQKAPPFSIEVKARVRWRRRERDVAMGHAATVVIGNEGVAGQHLG